MQTWDSHTNTELHIHTTQYKCITSLTYMLKAFPKLFEKVKFS